MSADESIWSRCSPLIRIFPLPLIPMSLQTLAHFSALPPLDPPPCPPLLSSACSVYTGFRQPQIDHRELTWGGHKFLQIFNKICHSGQQKEISQNLP